MNHNLPQDLDRESLNQLSKEELVEIIIRLGATGFSEVWEKQATMPAGHPCER